MSAKIIFDKKSEIPEHLQAEAKETEDGKFELDAKGVLNKNRELLGDNKTLATEKADLKDQLLAFDGKVAVTPQIKELGELAQSAGLKKSEIPTLKTKADELQKQIDSFAGEKQIDEVATAKNFNNKFKTMAKEKGLKFEKATETVDGKPVDKWLVVNGDAKSSIDDFLKTDSFFKEFADTFAGEKQESTGFNFGEQGGKPKPANIFQAIREKEKAAVTTEAPDINARFGKTA